MELKYEVKLERLTQLFGRPQMLLKYENDEVKVKYDDDSLMDSSLMFNPLVPSEHDEVKDMIIDQEESENAEFSEIDNTLANTQENARIASEGVQADGNFEIDFYKKSHLQNSNI